MKLAMPGEELATLILRAVVGLGAILVVWYLWHNYNELVASGPKAEAAAARGNLQAAEKSATAQNKGIESLQKAGEEKQAKSRAAVEKAGKPQEKRAQEILAAPAVGQTDYERMVNRIDRELALP